MVLMVVVTTLVTPVLLRITFGGRERGAAEEAGSTA